VVRPERAQVSPSALLGRTNPLGPYTRGAAPGWHPSRRWRDYVALLSNGENWRGYLSLYEGFFRRLSIQSQLFSLNAISRKYQAA
jgi:hypothetical protein